MQSGRQAARVLLGDTARMPGELAECGMGAPRMTREWEDAPASGLTGAAFAARFERLWRERAAPTGADTRR
jgi:hypothetical protein